MKTKLMVALAAFTMCICTSLHASETQKIKKERVFPSEKMINDLKLNNKQVIELKKIAADFKTEAKELKTKDQLSKKDRAQAFKKINDDKKNAIKKCLTTEQYIKYLEAQVEHLQKMAMKDKMKDNNNRRHNKKDTTKNETENSND